MLLELFVLELFFFELPLDWLDLVVWVVLALLVDEVLLFSAQEEKNATVARQTIAVRMVFFIGSVRPEYFTTQ